MKLELIHLSRFRETKSITKFYVFRVTPVVHKFALPLFCQSSIQYKNMLVLFIIRMVYVRNHSNYGVLNQIGSQPRYTSYYFKKVTVTNEIWRRR